LRAANVRSAVISADEAVAEAMRGAFADMGAGTSVTPREFR